VARRNPSGHPWRVKLVLHYDGRDYHGWQVQPGQRTVQGELSSLLGRLCGGTAPMITAAGRTDQGVHATGQVASALIPGRFDPRELQGALNALAPPDLWVASAERVPDAFHPRYDAVSRTYVYRLGVTPDCSSPFVAPWCWPLGRLPEDALLEAATRTLPGNHDFGAFAKSGQPERGSACDVQEAEWRDSPDLDGIREFRITADRYLHRMVRYLVGTLVDIGLGVRPIDHMSGLLAGAPGLVSSPPAPAKGLFLTRVDYSTDVSHDNRDEARKGKSA
jgi:tRNA pseudouridine38-40 synthase